MSQHQDRRIHADALRRHYRFSQAKRFKRQALVMMASVALGGLIVPHMMLPPGTMQATGTYYFAKAKTWFASGTTAEPGIMVDYGGERYERRLALLRPTPIFGMPRLRRHR